MCEDKEGYKKFNNGCYKWVEEDKLWSEAEEHCAQDDAHLVSIWDNLEQAYAFTNVKTVQSWIGLHKAQVGDETYQGSFRGNMRNIIILCNISQYTFYLQDNDVYEWSDGSKLGDYSNWLRSQGPYVEWEQCAVLDTEIWDCTDTCEYPDGNWISRNCTEKHPFMCKVKEGL